MRSLNPGANPGLNRGNPGKRTPEARANMAKANKRIWSSPELRSRQSNTIKGLWLDPAYRAETTKAATAAKAAPEVHSKFVESAKKMWTRAEYRAHQAAAANLDFGGKVANCKRWNINRGKPCTCGRHAPKA